MVPRPTIDALTSYVSTVDRSFTLASLFGLSHGPTLCYQSIQRVRELEDGELEKGVTIRARHAGPVTQASLVRLATSGGLNLSWQDYRINVLASLSDKGLPGIAELLKCTMTVLKKTMEGKGDGGQRLSQ